LTPTGPQRVLGPMNQPRQHRVDEAPLQSAAPSAVQRNNEAMRHLVDVVQQLSLARDLETIMAIVRLAARELTGADGATFVLKDGPNCYYAEENAIEPLWKGQRFPLTACVSGWAMNHREAVMIPDIYLDDRVPQDAYRPTFVKSLAMVPIRTANPIGAIGNYWAHHHVATADELALLEALANTTAVAMENVQVYAELEERVAARTRELAVANKELEAFSYSVSHDLRAPLRAVNGYCRIFIEDFGAETPAEGLQVLGKAMAGAERMGALIEDLLEFSRLSRQPLDASSVSLNGLAQRALDAQHLATSGRNIETTLAELGNCEGDASLLEQVFVNLITNACKFTRGRDPARIEIGAEQRNGERVLFVRDNGAGFDMKFAGKLFGVFQRMHTPQEFEGTGVGLSIVQRVIERHGGRIWAEAEVGRGATFYFTLPEGVSNRPDA
jgi:signal transduction histidine kinase